MQGNLLDLAILAVLLASLVIGYQKGFIGAIAGIVSTVTGIIVAMLFRTEAAGYLQARFGMITDLANFLEKKLIVSAGAENPSPWISTLPIVQNGMAAMHRKISEFAYLLVAAACFLVLYLVSSQLIILLCMLLERALPRWMLGGINRPGGMAVILTQNVLIMVVVAGILAGPLDLAAKMGIKVATPAANLMQGSALLPCLLDSYKWLQVLIEGWF
ncbi:MAG: hypothetical protein GYA42_05620 [Syntrophomonadaceae bacterium]|nr:hypothetical protein [Syntrophomonadaceae bacterium]